MTLLEFAESLQDRDALSLMTEEETNLAKEKGYVLVSGWSDDLMEFDGAIEDEASVYGGGVVRFDINGVLPDVDDLDEDELEEWLKRKKTSRTITANRCEKEPYSWSYDTEIPHEKISLKKEGDDFYCEAILFDLNSI